MRRSLTLLAAFLLAAFGSAAPAAAPAVRAATADPKVAIIVGATHDVTPSYRADADSAYAVAIQYTSNVVKVYSPNATWTKVKAATAGASIVIYFGHGNGWPSPYTYDPKYTTKDGFGLNYDLNGDGKLSDYENKYYGEPSVATLDLAPNAVVLLSHLCYASGNSEPGMAAPSLTVARQRVDNYAAGFLKAGAQAVIADGHRGPEDYIRALFTTKQSIASLWRNQPNFHGHESSFASSRTPGATAYMDPDTTTGGYYRSMVAQPGLTSDDVTGASGAGTTDDPSNLIVPGNAQVVGDGAQLFDDATLDPAGLAVAGTVASGARMRVLAEAPADPVSGATPVQVQGIDDPDLTGWMDASALVPKDSTAPALWNVAASTRISPNGDGRSDSASLTARVSETADWRFRIKAPGGATIVDRTGHGTAVDLSWDALTGGAAVADGAYTWSLQATDTWENGPTTKTGTITVDTKAPSLAAVTPPSSEVRWISPNGDLAKESMTWATTMSETGSLRLKVADPDGATVRSTTFSAKGGASATATWDGKDSDGAVVPDGTYKITLTPRDTAGTDGKAVTRSLVVDTSLGDVDATKTLFFPQDGDGLAKTTTLRFTLTRPAVVTWTLVDADGDVAMTLLDGASLPAGQVTRVFDGKLPDGTYLPRGAYRSTVTLAGDSAPVISQYRTITLRAFIPTASDTTPGRGQKVTIYATSAETLSGNPRVYVTQPGKATWSVATSKVSTGKYKATLTIKTGGASGTIRFRVTGTDTGDGKQSADLSLPLH